MYNFLYNVSHETDLYCNKQARSIWNDLDRDVEVLKFLKLHMYSTDRTCLTENFPIYDVKDHYIGILVPIPLSRGTICSCGF